jgi:hypothetical protein
MNFIKIGRHIINLNQITNIEWTPAGHRISFRADGTRYQYTGYQGLAIYNHLKQHSFDADGMAEFERQSEERNQAITAAGEAKGWTAPF